MNNDGTYWRILCDHEKLKRAPTVTKAESVEEWLAKGNMITQVARGKTAYISSHRVRASSSRYRKLKGKLK